MKASHSSGEAKDLSKSIVLVSSIAGITEAPGLFAYSTAKHGVIGLMRALRPWAPLRYGVRVNALCPWATDTQLLGVKEKWLKEKMPLNTPTDVGKIIIQCSADRGLNGKAIFITGGRFFDTEEGIDRTLPQWMGEQNAKEFLKGQELLGLVSSYLIFDSECFVLINHIMAGRRLDRLSRQTVRGRAGARKRTLDGRRGQPNRVEVLMKNINFNSSIQFYIMQCDNETLNNKFIRWGRYLPLNLSARSDLVRVPRL